jgi:hypothetical protein
LVVIVYKCIVYITLLEKAWQNLVITLLEKAWQNLVTLLEKA